MYRIPVYQPSLRGNETKYVLECLTSTWISSKGRFIADFERAFARYTASAFAACVCNGTVGLHLALEVLGIGPGDEVLVPTLTYVASANAIRYTGATPKFVDSRADTWQCDIEQLASRITPRTRAVMAVHLYNGCCDMAALRGICAEHGLLLVEDCAESFGTSFDGLHTGNFGSIGVFSFFGNKTVTTGEGGMLVCNDPSLDRRIRHLRGQGLAEAREYWHDALGYNYRMTNVCAAIGLAQMERADELVAAKARLAAGYAERLRDVPVSFQAIEPLARSPGWMVSVLVEDARDRDPLRRRLADAGIETRPLFHPLHTMDIHRTPGEAFPVAEDLARRGLNLPSWPDLGDDALDEICEHVRAQLGSSR